VLIEGVCCSMHSKILSSRSLPAVAGGSSQISPIALVGSGSIWTDVLLLLLKSFVLVLLLQ
jgi:hypothetical protein